MGDADQSKVRQLLENIIYFPNWRNKRYVVWTLAIPLALFGYFVPYCHLPQFAEDIRLDEDDTRNGEKASQLIMCIGVSSGIGRLVSGSLADLPMIKKWKPNYSTASFFHLNRHLHHVAHIGNKLRRPCVWGYADILFYSWDL